jgi:hypothetical protein
MAVQYSTQKSGLVPVDDPIKSRHDLKTTRESIKALLANGTPDWVRWPSDYKAFVKESFAAEKEASNEMVEGYKIDGQDILTDEKPRKVHPIATREFVKKLRDNGVRCFTVDNGLAGTVALWAARGQQMVYICFLQVPAQYEWSVLRLDSHNLPAGERYRGWRTVLAQLIVKEILSEEKAHQIFGRPQGGVISSRYRRTLWNFRNGKRNPDVKAVPA